MEMPRPQVQKGKGERKTSLDCDSVQSVDKIQMHWRGASSSALVCTRHTDGERARARHGYLGMLSCGAVFAFAREPPLRLFP